MASPGSLLQIVTKHGMEDCLRRWLRCLQQHQGLITGIRKNRTQCGDEVAQEQVEIAFLFIQRKPGRRQRGWLLPTSSSQVRKPGAYQGGFAITGRCTDQGQRVVNAAAELREQPGTVDQTPGDRRLVQLGLEKDFIPVSHI